MYPNGGTEILHGKVSETLANRYKDEINLITVLSDKNIDSTKKNVCWNHLHIDEPNVLGHANPKLISKIDRFVFVSHSQYFAYLAKFKIPEEKCVVIKNASYATEYKPKQKTDKLKLIYTSTPWRGLDVVLKAFQLLERDDVELHVYSSTKIYGDFFEKNVDPETKSMFEEWYEVAGSLPNSYYHGYAPNEEVLKQLQDTHIFAYPSIFWETSCLAAIEAMLAGCKVVTTNFGALPETCGDWATYVPYSRDRVDLAERYSEVLNKEIDRYWDETNQKRLERQVAHYNEFYSWDARIPEWDRLFSSLVRERPHIRRVA